MVISISSKSLSKKTWTNKIQETISRDQDVDKGVPDILSDILKTKYKIPKGIDDENEIEGSYLTISYEK